MQVHLSKPDGKRQGPLTVQQINEDLAAHKYRDTDYWAWYEGLEAWVPLHAVPGVSASAGSGVVTVATEEGAIAVEREISSTEGSGADSSIESIGATNEPQTASIANSGISSGMPFTALEQVFIFTNGEGREVMQSSVATTMLEKVIGTDLEAIKERAPRDVFGRCKIAERVRGEGKVPGSAWRAMSALKPELIQQARGGKYHTCVRTFVIDNEEAVAIFLFYNKAKM